MAHRQLARLTSLATQRQRGFHPRQRSLASTPRLRSRRHRRQSPAAPRWRLTLVWASLVVAMVGIGARLIYVQIHQGDSLRQRAQQQQKSSPTPRALRHPIVDRRGNLLAVDQIVYTLYSHPALFKQSYHQVATALAPLLETSPAQLQETFGQQSTGIKLADELSPERRDRIQALQVDGLELIPQVQRVYPQEELFAQVVGFINAEGEAQTGLEVALEERLAIPPNPASPQSSSLRLQLTLDSQLQRIAQQELQRTLRQYGARRGTVMVMDAQDGTLLAMAVAPTYDPNRYYEADLDTLRNWAVSDLYEPGSTFKPITMAIALEAGAVQPGDTLYDEGQLILGEWTIRNFDYAALGGHGTLTLTEILKYSSNVGMVHLMQRLQPATYYHWLQRLDLLNPTGIELPAEATAQLPSREQFLQSSVERATVAFGQGLALTPIQLLRLHGALANGGKLVTPHVVRGLVDASGELQWQPQRLVPQHLFSSDTTQQVIAMMETVVDSGTGQVAQINGYQIAGKTGTAQKVTTGGRYGTGRITSFVAIAPAEAPRYVVLAVIDEPWGENAYGSTVAAPLVKTVMEPLLVMTGVAPSNPEAINGVE
ncbi:cell division protein [Halomicronema hongdechloris C2206]|uniref:Cell division protein n=1 Tax=Halomicronema hongdechloris C2206 TaxID=1641165 RepID=A0A1Z3HIV1_9CYAN|nr:penicillin-binding protein 2 [Halomicronema hongdechloris]ASC70215.1 cell division protein [Halomicronema hongdechloris C2206]